MKIVVDFRNTYNSDTALSVFTREFWQDVTRLKYDHAFVFITDRAALPDMPVNVTIRKLKKTGIRWWDQLKLNRLLIALQADRFINILQTGFSIFSFSATQKKEKSNGQPDRSVFFFDNGEDYPQTNLLPGPAVTYIKPAFREVVTALPWAAAESVKTQYTGGRSFFLFAGNISERHQLLALLKAFSAFKKWQQSNMQLVIAGHTTSWTNAFEEKLLTYKYKTAVTVLKNPAGPELAKLAAAAYALVSPSAENVFPLALLLAVQSGKAAIVSDTGSNRQVTAAAEWVDKNDTAAGFAKAMILLYKDEKHQQLLVQQVTEQAADFNRGQMLAQAWQCIEK